MKFHKPKFWEYRNFISLSLFPLSLIRTSFNDKIFDNKDCWNNISCLFENHIFSKKNKKPIMLLVSKSKSYDKSFKGDFNLTNNQITRDEKNDFIFTGLQIIKRSFLTSENSKVFSMNKIWNDLIANKELYGIESNLKFYHLNTHEMYLKISNIKITD